MYEILKRGKIHNLSISCQLNLFDKIVKPMLLFGSEVWGFCNTEPIEKIHFKFCKLLLGLEASTLNVMIYSELGMAPLRIDIKQRMIPYCLTYMWKAN